MSILMESKNDFDKKFYWVAPCKARLLYCSKEGFCVEFNLRIFSSCKSKLFSEDNLSEMKFFLISIIGGTEKISKKFFKIAD